MNCFWSAHENEKVFVWSLFVVSFRIMEMEMPYMYIIFPQLNATSIYVKFGLVDCVFIWLLLFIWALCSWSKISVFIHHFWQPCTCISPLYLTLIYYIGQILEELYYVDLYLEDTAFIQDWGNALFVKAYSFHCHMAHLGKKRVNMSVFTLRYRFISIGIFENNFQILIFWLSKNHNHFLRVFY